MNANYIDEYDDNYDIVNDPKYINLLLHLSAKIKSKGNQWISYTRIYDFGDDFILNPGETSEETNVELPENIENFIKNLMKIGDEEIYGKNTIFAIDVNYSGILNKSFVVVRGLFEEKTKDLCEETWETFKIILDPLEEEAGVYSSGSFIKASYK